MRDISGSMRNLAKHCGFEVRKIARPCAPKRTVARRCEKGSSMSRNGAHRRAWRAFIRSFIRYLAQRRASFRFLTTAEAFRPHWRVFPKLEFRATAEATCSRSAAVYPALFRLLPTSARICSHLHAVFRNSNFEGRTVAKACGSLRKSLIAQVSTYL